MTRVVLAVCMLAGALVVAPRPAGANYPGANGKIAYVRVDPEAGTSQIFLAGPDGSDPQRITSTSRSYGGLDWAADGSKLAFEVATAGGTEIWVIDADGSNPRRVSPEGEDRRHPSWSPDGRYLAVDSGGTIYRIDTEAGHELVLRTPEEITVSCNGQEEVHPVYYQHPVYSPEGARLALIRFYELPPVDNMGSCDPNVFFAFDLGVMPAGGGGVTVLTDDPDTLAGARFETLPDWSPDGREIVFQRSAARGSDFGIATVNAGGGAFTQVTNFGARPRFSPDGTKILFSRDANEDGLVDTWAMDRDGSDQAAVLQREGFAHVSHDWQPTTAGELDVTLSAFGPDGTSLLDDVIGMSQTVKVQLTIKNPGEEEVTGFRFAGDAPLVIDERSTGGLEITDQPVIDPELTLEPDEDVTFDFDVTATANGIAAAHTKVTATDESGRSLEDVHSLKFVIEDGAAMTDALGQYVTLMAMDQLILQSLRSWYSGMQARATDLQQRLSAIFTPEQRLRWFGSADAFPLTPTDFAIAFLRGTIPEMVAASRPKARRWEGHTIEQLDNAYQAAFKAEVGKGIAEYVEGYANLAGSVKRGLQDSYAEALMTSYYLFGNATPQERMEVEAYMYAAATGSDTSVDNLVNTIGREIPQWKENLTYLDEAADMAVADAFLLSPDLVAQMQAETQWRENVLARAQAEPVAFQQAVAKRDAEIFNLGMPVVLDTLIGGGVSKFTTRARDIIVRGRGAAVMRSGEAVGALDNGGHVADGPLKIKVGDPAAPGGASSGEAMQLEKRGNYLDDVEGATIVQSTDAGRVYELPNVGGVPEVTIDAKAAILAELETDYARKFGTQIKLAEVLKPSSAYRKVDGIAKLELTPQKTGKAAMLDAGAPSETLAEASVWRNTRHPADQAGWRNLSKARQEAALKEWRAANQRWDEWIDPPAGSKTARLQQCIGQRARVPLDTQPNAAGLQRFVVAEFEEVAVREGTAEARLIRAKYYRIETVDTTRGNQIVNSKVVVDSPTALPQTPDADAVALGKVTGFDAEGNPIVAPLSRAEREFLAQRYIDKNIKARKKKPGTKGAIPDAAEHGTTLIMDDASAQAAGKLLPSYGIPFMPEGPGRTMLRRIAPFVAKIPPGTGPAQRARIIQAQYKQMLHAVRSEGGFGQHAIVVTSDSRYLGAVQFENW